MRSPTIDDKILLDKLAEKCKKHFPQHHYKWPETDIIGVHCAKCGTDYTIQPTGYYTYTGADMYEPSKGDGEE